MHTGGAHIQNEENPKPSTLKPLNVYFPFAIPSACAAPLLLVPVGSVERQVARQDREQRTHASSLPPQHTHHHRVRVQCSPACSRWKCGTAGSPPASRTAQHLETTRPPAGRRSACGRRSPARRTMGCRKSGEAKVDKLHSVGCVEEDILELDVAAGEREDKERGEGAEGRKAGRWEGGSVEGGSGMCGG
eukprot:347530-Chlamydomonas_euryale.AAC.2